MKKLYLFILSAMLFVNVLPVLAQGEAPYVLGSTRPISGDLREYLDEWLAVDAPSTAFYYFVTYSKDRDVYWITSLVGVNLDSPSDTWSLDDYDTIVWIGTVRVNKIGGDVSPYPEKALTRAPGLSNMKSAAGGGLYVDFPFQAGTTALYGPLGVHGEGQYSTSGMYFIDLVGGDDMGASIMPPYVYASDAGTVDYVCDDGVNVAIRTHNSDTGDYFMYAHLLDNASLDYDVEFAHGETIGTLKYGTFTGGSPSCGGADQQSDHYHVHWGFVPAGGSYRVAQCSLDMSSEVWQCGDEQIRIGGYLTGGAGTGIAGGSDGGETASSPSFFDYILGGIVGLVTRSIFDLLPAHEPFKYTYAIFNTLGFFFKITYVLVQSNLSLRWIVIVIVYAFTVKVTMGAISITPSIFRVAKWIVPGM